MLLPFFQPRERAVLLAIAELPHFGMDKVLSDAWEDFRNVTVRYRGNAFNISLMIRHKLEVRHQRCEVLPSRKGLHEIINPDSVPFCAMKGSIVSESLSKSAFSSGSAGVTINISLSRIKSNVSMVTSKLVCFAPFSH
jgi:hypothetical protein